MKHLMYIRFDVPSGSEAAARQVLADLELHVPAVFDHQDSDILATSHTVLVPERLAERLLDTLKHSEIDERPFCRPERKYTAAELQSAELFWVQMQKQRGDGYTVYGTRYDSDDACGLCGSGIVQGGDLVVNGSDFKGVHLATTYNFEVVISRELHEALKPLGGCSFGQVVDHRSGVCSEKLRQLIPGAILPGLVPPTRISRSSLYCEKCGRNGVFLDSEMHLGSVPAAVADFYRTCEFFGEMRERACPGPELVLSRRAVEIIRKFDKRALKVEPVFLGDSIMVYGTKTGKVW